MRHRGTVVGGVLLLALVSACGDDDAEEPGIANPASEFCVEQGGRVENERDDAGNEHGICVLPDGTRVDEWEYYRQHGDE